MPRRARRPGPLALLAGLLFEVLSTAAVVGVPAVWLASHADLASLAARQGSTAFGRTVTIGGLKLGYGPVLTIDLRDAGIANTLPNTPPAFTVRHLTASLDRAALLQGKLVIQQATVDGLAILLERNPDRVPNWRFGTERPSATNGRAGFPSLRDLRLHDSQVTYRLASGHDLVTRLDDVAITTAADDQPARLTIAGAYNATPVTLDADLQPIAALRDSAKPYGTVLHFASGSARLTFDGTMTDPLNFDGLDGTLALDAEDPRPVFAIAGLETAFDAAVNLDGPFQHLTPAWRLHDVRGQIGTDEVTRAALDFEEGPARAPDSLALDLAFATLNLNDMLGTGTRGKRAGADMSLSISRDPATLIRAKVTAARFDYNDIAATQASIEAAQTPGRITVDTLALDTFGTRVVAHGAIEAVGAGGRVTAEIAASGADVQALGRTLGFGALPLTGRIDAQVVVDATAPTLNAATRDARVSAVVAMRGGKVQRQIVEKASTDLRSLFRTDRGLSPVTCLLAGVDMRANVGTVAPLRLRAADGTISGSARFDLNRRTFDLTIGSEASTTGLFALDIPVRVSGPFASPSVSPAQWSPQGRAQLAAADSLSALPPALREWARKSPCPPAR